MGKTNHNLGTIKSHKIIFLHAHLSELLCRPRNITNYILGVSEFVVGWESEMYNATEGEAVELCLRVRSESTVVTSVRFSVNDSSGQAQGMWFHDIVYGRFKKGDRIYRGHLHDSGFLLWLQ